MQVQIRSYLGSEGLVERFEVTTPDGAQAELRWADCSRQILGDATTRVRDAATFLEEHPHPVAPRPVGVAVAADGVGLMIEPFRGPTLATLCYEPLPLAAALEVGRRLTSYLDHLARLRSEGRRRFTVAIRCLGPETVRIRGDGEVRLTGVETLGGDWPGRVVRTTQLERTRDTRLAVLGKDPADDLFDLGRVLLALSAGSALAQELDAGLATVRDPRTHDRQVQEVVSARRLKVPPDLLALLQRLLAYHPDERPAPHLVIDALTGLFGSPSDLQEYARAACRGWRWLPAGHHPMLGRTLEARAVAEDYPTDEVALPVSARPVVVPKLVPPPAKGPVTLIPEVLPPAERTELGRVRRVSAAQASRPAVDPVPGLVPLPNPRRAPVPDLPTLGIHGDQEVVLDSLPPPPSAPPSPRRSRPNRRGVPPWVMWLAPAVGALVGGLLALGLLAFVLALLLVGGFLP